MKNHAFVPLYQARHELVAGLSNPTTLDDAESMLDYGTHAATQTSAIRILHPLFIKSWKEPRRSVSDAPLQVVGLDVETEATTGKPMLLGFWYPEDKRYYSIYQPTLTRFARVVRNLRDKSSAHLCVWGGLDLQIIMRLFTPTERE